MVYETALAECARENLRLELRIAPTGEGIDLEKIKAATAGSGLGFEREIS
jgi:hypothetical protein